MGVSPALSAAKIRRLTVSSVSPKYWRRSLCPMMTWLQPVAAIIGPETSPVNAPESSQ